MTCPLEDAHGWKPPEVTRCPCCGGDVEETDTSSAWRCVETGKTFYVEV